MAMLRLLALILHLVQLSNCITSSPTECHDLFIDLSKADGNCEQTQRSKGATSPSWNSNYRNAVSKPRFQCPSEIHLSWLDRPPFFYNQQNNNSNSQGDSVAGVFVDLIRSSLSVCCRKYGYFRPNVSLDRTPARSLSELHMSVFKRNVTASYMMMAPVITDHKKFRYLQVLDQITVFQSPGEILILDKEKFYSRDRQEVWSSLEGVWLVIALSLLISVLSGVIIWALDTLWNPDDFPNSFSKGTSEGFWWAFVTMTTVGYGDRTPKSFFGRLFGVLWIVFGISLCSVMTATITTAMTSINVNKDVDMMNKNIAVLDGSNSITEAVKNFAEPKVFHNIRSMFDALRKDRVDGILLEKYMAAHALHHNDYTDVLIGKVYQSLHSYGFAFWKREKVKDVFPAKVKACLANVFMDKEGDVTMVINKHLHWNGKEMQLKPKEMIGFFTMKSPLFKNVFIILGASCALIFACALIERLYHRNGRAQKGDIKKTVTQKGEEA